eukprot:jgi/Phyca11/103617/e_gw1.8.178.1
MNEFGEGAVVQQSLIEANGDWHMERAIAHFKRSHPTRIEKLRVIVVDKDLNEIRVLEEHFSKARVIICHFHVIKYLKEKRSKPEFGKISSEDAPHIDAAIHKVVYAQSEDQYKDANESLRGICVRTGMDDFFEYFQKNWDASQDRWVSYLRSQLPHFKNHTNNRLESFFGKVKDAVDGSMSMALCIKSIVGYDRRMQNEYEYRLSRIGRFVNSNYDEEMTNVLRFTTHYVAQQIEQQYAAAVAKSSSYNYSDNKMPKLKICKNPVLVQDPFYLLPTKLLDACCRFAGFQAAVVKTTRTRKTEKTALSEDVRDCVLRQAQEQGVESVFIPLNFGNLHWCCVVVKVAAKRICYYDPLNQPGYMNTAKEVAVSLKIAGLNDFDVISQNNPIQFDGFSCGVFVCWMFINQDKLRAPSRYE